MTTYSDSAIEAAARAMDTRALPRDNATAALTAAAPAIQAAAWDAVIARIDLGTPYMVDEKYVAGANWVRNQIEDVLKPTIEGESE